MWRHLWHYPIVKKSVFAQEQLFLTPHGELNNYQKTQKKRDMQVHPLRRAD